MAIKELTTDAVEETSNLSFREKVSKACSNITVEPIIFLYMFPSVFSILAMQNFNLEKACRVDLDINDTLCDSIMSHNKTNIDMETEVAVQKLVATWAMVKVLLNSFLASLTLPFLGSWSDRHRRRLPVIYLPIVGEMIAQVLFILLVYFFDEVPLFGNILADAIPQGLAGGWYSMALGLNSYVSDMSEPKERTFRIGVLNMIQTISIPIGLACSGLLLPILQYYGMFSVSLAILACSIVYSVIFVKEVPQAEKKYKSDKSFIADFYDIKKAKEAFKITFHKGANRQRTKILCCIGLGMISLGPIHGEMTVLYLFLRKKFLWNEVQYAKYLTVHFLIQIIGTGFTISFISKKLQVHDALIGCAAAVTKIIASIWFAFAPTGELFYVGALLECIHGTSFIAIRSMMSKIVKPEDLGKVYAMYGFFETFMPLLYVPMYTSTYKATIETFPSAFYLLAAGMTVPCIFVFLWLYKQHRHEVRQDKLEKDIAVADSLL